MKLAQIRHLVAVAECGDLRSAAAALGVSQHALVRSIRSLEQELGAALFTRAKASMTLTPVGEIFVRRAAAAQLELDRAHHELSQTRGSSAECVTIGMSASPQAEILPKVLAPFQERFPAVRLRIVEGDFAKLQRDVCDGVLDIYVGPMGPHRSPEGLKIDRLHDAARVVVGRKDHPLASAAALADLENARWIAASEGEIDELFKRHGLGRPHIAVEAATGLGLLAAVVSSDALLVLPASWLPLVDRTGLLAPLRLDEALDPEPIHMVTRTPPPPPAPATAWLHDLILRLVRGDGAAG